ncbi:MAG TPA: hypothetical protein VIM99_09620, partial [Blastocatellia bacterium]
VYGGGGIEPDVKVPPVNFLSVEYFTPAQARLFSGVFMFVRELVNGQIAEHPEFKTNGIKFDHNLGPNEFIVTDSVLNSFREFAKKFYKDNPGHGVTPAMIEDNIVWLRARIRYEVLTAAYGADKADQGLADLDIQLQRAISEMPNAAELARRSWRHNTANTGFGVSNKPERR